MHECGGRSLRSGLEKATQRADASSCYHAGSGNDIVREEVGGEEVEEMRGKVMREVSERNYLCRRRAKQPMTLRSRRSPPTWSRSDAFNYERDEHCVDIWLRSTPCIGCISSVIFSSSFPHHTGVRFTQSRERFTRRKADCVGFVHNKQSARHSIAFILGDDMRLRALRLLCRMRRSRQYLQVKK